MNLQAINSGNPDLGIGFSLVDKRELWEQNAAILKNREAAFFIGNSMPTRDDRLLSATEIAEIFQVSRDEIYKLARCGAIPGYKIGGAWRFDLTRVKDCCKSECRKCPEPNGNG